MAKRKRSKQNTNHVSGYTTNTLSELITSGMALDINYEPMSAHGFIDEFAPNFETAVHPMNYKAGVLSVNATHITLMIEVNLTVKDQYVWLTRRTFTWQDIFDHARVSKYPLIKGVYINRHETKTVRYNFAPSETVKSLRNISRQAIIDAEEYKQNTIPVSWLGRIVGRIAS